MDTIQVILLVLAALILYRLVKKWIAARSLKNYTSSEVKQMLKENKNIVLLDVRTSLERNNGSIKGSMHLPLNEISFKHDTLKKFQGHEIICYCASGSRSVAAALKLKKLGYNSSNMAGGYYNW